MKKIFLCFIVLCSLFLFVACGEHTHTFSKEWSSDEEFHFHQCESKKCDEVADKEAHTFDAGVVTKEATQTTEGEKTFTCNVCGYKKVINYSLSNIITVLGQKNNTDVLVSAVVFGKTNDGLYIADATGGVLVKVVSSKVAALANVLVGDLVEVSGKFALNNNQPFIKNADFTVKKSGETPISSVEKTIAEVIASNPTDKTSYGKLYKINGAASLDPANRLVLTDDTATIIIDNKDSYNEFVGKKISTEITLLKMGDGQDGWIAYGFSNKTQVFEVNLDDVKEAIFNSIELTNEVIGALVLPVSYEAEPDVLFTWSVKSGTAITITENVCDVALNLTNDEDVTLTLTLSVGEKTATSDYTVKVKALKNVTIAEGKLLGEEFAVVTALVVATGTADEKSQFHYIFLMDETTKELAVIDVEAKDKQLVKVGDRISFIANYRTSERPSFTNLKAVKVLQSNILVDYASLATHTLDSLESYQFAANNYHDEIRLYKIVNPFMVRSGNSEFNWNLFGPTKDTANAGVYKDRYFSLLIDNFKVNGLADIEEGFNVPKKQDGANAYPGVVMYCYSIYQTGETRWSFVIPARNAYNYDLTAVVNSQIDKAVEKEVMANEAGTFTIPSSVTCGDVTYTLTWTSSNNDVLNAETGAFTKVDANTVVTLTATYVIDENTYTYDVLVTLTAAEVPAISVSDAINAGSGDVVKLQAYVAAVAASSENAEQFRSGLMLTDGIKVIYYNTTEYAVNEVEIKAGDLLEIKNARITVDEDGQTLVGGDVTIVSSNNNIDYSKLEVTVTVSSDEELASFLASHNPTKGLVVKFTGSFYFVGTGSSAKNPRFQLNYKNATSSAAARYPFKDYVKEDDGNRTVCFSMPSTEQLLKKEWWTDCNMPLKSGSKSFAVEGTIYAVGGYNGKTLQAWTVINGQEFNVIPQTEASKVKNELKKLVNITTVNGTEAGVYNLIQEVKLGEVTYPLTWSSSDEEVLNSTTGAYGAVTANKQVTLTATFTVDAVSYTFEIKVTIEAAKIEASTVSEVILAGSADVEKLQAYVAAIGATSDNNEDYRNGIMLTDGVNVIYYKTTEYTCGAQEIKAGDLLVISNASIVVNEDGQTLTGGTVEIISSDNVIDYSNLNITVTVSNDEELANFLKQHKSTKGLVVKFTGNFYFVGTGSTSKNARYQLNYKNAAKSADARYQFQDYKDDNDGNRTVCFSMPSTEQLLGRKWWEDCDMPLASGSKSYAVKGTIIAVGGYNGKTLHSWTVIDAASFNVEKVVTE